MANLTSCLWPRPTSRRARRQQTQGQNCGFGRCHVDFVDRGTTLNQFGEKLRLLIATSERVGIRDGLEHNHVVAGSEVIGKALGQHQ